MGNAKWARSAFLIASALLLFFVVSAQGRGQPEMTAIDRWPENSYTGQIPKPEFGHPVTLIRLERGCGVVVEGCTTADFDAYARALRERGYTELERAADGDSSALPFCGDLSSAQLSYSRTTLLISVSDTPISIDLTKYADAAL